MRLGLGLTVATALGGLGVTGCVAPVRAYRLELADVGSKAAPEAVRRSESTDPGAVLAPEDRIGRWVPAPESPAPRPRVGVVAGAFFFDRSLGLDDAFFAGPRFTVPLRRNWDLDLPVKIAFSGATTTTPEIRTVTTPPGPNPQPIVNVIPGTSTHADGTVVVAELALRHHGLLRDDGRWRVTGTLGAGLGVTWFDGFGQGDTLAPSAHLSAGFEAHRGRFTWGAEAQLHGLWTDFNGTSRSLKPALALGLGAGWDL